MVTLSVVVPVYSGEDFLETLVEELDRVRKAWQAENAVIELSEVIFVDDCAVDGSANLIERLAEVHEWVVALHLGRNSGQHPATIAGILHSSGDWLVSLDEDLQHPPAMIEALLRHAVKGNLDLVYAQPDEKVHDSRFRDLSSHLYKRIIEWLTGNPHIRKANSFRLIRGAVARGAASACSHETYLDVALAWFTQRIGVLPMVLKDQRYIRTGKSGYTFRALVSHARRLLVSSHLKVLRVTSLAGMVTVIFSMLAGLGLIIYKLTVPDAVPVRGWTSLMIAIGFFNGLLIVLMGVALEYISYLIQKAHGKPIFFTIDRSDDSVLRRYFDEHRE